MKTSLRFKTYNPYYIDTDSQKTKTRKAILEGALEIRTYPDDRSELNEYIDWIIDMLDDGGYTPKEAMKQFEFIKKTWGE